MARERKTPAAPAAAVVDARVVRAAAVARMLARRRPPEYLTVPDGRGGQVRHQVASGTEFLAPLTTADWCDDQMARLPLSEPYATVVLILEALRASGEDAAVAAVRQAAALGEWDQWAAWTFWQALPLPPRPPDGALAALRAIRQAWQAAGLATGRPDEGMPLRAVTLNQADLDAADARRRGRRTQPIPAGPVY